MKVLESVGVGTELSKRQHLDGVILTKECKCGEYERYYNNKFEYSRIMWFSNSTPISRGNCLVKGQRV